MAMPLNTEPEPTVARNTLGSLLHAWNGNHIGQMHSHPLRTEGGMLLTRSWHSSGLIRQCEQGSQLSPTTAATHSKTTFPACTHQEHVSTSPCLSDTHKQHVTLPYCLSVADQQHVPIPPCLPPTHKQQVQVHAVSHSPTSSTFQYALSRCTRCTSLPSTVHTKKSSQSLSSTSMSPCTCGT